MRDRLRHTFKLVSFRLYRPGRNENSLIISWRSFRSLHKFTQIMLAIFLLFLLLVIFRNYKILTSYGQVLAVESLASGNWSDPLIWSTGRVPTTGDKAVISKDHTITYDVQSDAILAGLDIVGTLQFSRTTNTRLKTSVTLWL